MSRTAKVRQHRLAQLEAEFQPLLLSCLVDAANGRYGLFGQHDDLDPEHRYEKWPNAQRVVETAMQIQALRSEAGESYALVERFLYFRSLGGSNVLGEPKLAKKFLEEIHAASRSGG